MWYKLQPFTQFCIRFLLCQVPEIVKASEALFFPFSLSSHTAFGTCVSWCQMRSSPDCLLPLDCFCKSMHVAILICFELLDTFLMCILLLWERRKFSKLYKWNFSQVTIVACMHIHYAPLHQHGFVASRNIYIFIHF